MALKKENIKWSLERFYEIAIIKNDDVYPRIKEGTKCYEKYSKIDWKNDYSLYETVMDKAIVKALNQLNIPVTKTAQEKNYGKICKKAADNFCLMMGNANVKKSAKIEAHKQSVKIKKQYHRKSNYTPLIIGGVAALIVLAVILNKKK